MFPNDSKQPNCYQCCPNERQGYQNAENTKREIFPAILTLSQIKQQESQTNKLIINKYTKDNNRYIIEYYIKHLIPITKKYKKRKTKRTNIQVDVKSTNRTTAPQLECIFQLIELINNYINIKIKQNKSVISNILRPYCTLIQMLFNHSKYVIS